MRTSAVAPAVTVTEPMPLVIVCYGSSLLDLLQFSH